MLHLSLARGIRCITILKRLRNAISESHCWLGVFVCGFFVFAFSTHEGDTSGIALKKKNPTRACLEVKNVASQMTAMKHSGVERGLAFRAAHLQLLQLASYVC